jgi:hypothetical protein
MLTFKHGIVTNESSPAFLLVVNLTRVEEVGDVPLYGSWRDPPVASAAADRRTSS